MWICCLENSQCRQVLYQRLCRYFNTINHGTFFTQYPMHSRQTTIRCWMDDECLHPKIVQVLTIVIACNSLMNGVDKFDQIPATNIKQRRERLVPMSIYKFVLDGTVLNAYAVNRTLKLLVGEHHMLIRKSKGQIAQSWCSRASKREASGKDEWILCKKRVFSHPGAVHHRYKCLAWVKQHVPMTFPSIKS